MPVIGTGIEAQTVKSKAVIRVKVAESYKTMPVQVPLEDSFAFASARGNELITRNQGILNELISSAGFLLYSYVCEMNP